MKHVRISPSFLLLFVSVKIFGLSKNIEKSIFYECKKITFNKFQFRLYIYKCVCVCVKLKINPRIRNCTNKETGCPEDSSDCCIHLYCKNLNYILAALFFGLLQVFLVYICIEIMQINERHLRKVGGYNGRNIVFYLLTIKIRTTLRKITTKTTRTLFPLISTYIASKCLCSFFFFFFVHIKLL